MNEAAEQLQAIIEDLERARRALLQHDVLPARDILPVAIAGLEALQHEVKQHT